MSVRRLPSTANKVINTVQTGDEKQRQREGFGGELLKGQMEATTEQRQNEI